MAQVSRESAVWETWRTLAALRQLTAFQGRDLKSKYSPKAAEQTPSWGLGCGAAPLSSHAAPFPERITIKLGELSKETVPLTGLHRAQVHQQLVTRPRDWI